jgi:hypothetical protein
MYILFVKCIAWSKEPLEGLMVVWLVEKFPPCLVVKVKEILPVTRC